MIVGLPAAGAADQSLPICYSNACRTNAMT